MVSRLAGAARLVIETERGTDERDRQRGREVPSHRIARLVQLGIHAERAQVNRVATRKAAKGGPKNREEVNHMTRAKKLVEKDMTTSVIRSWAQENGHDVGMRGRIAADIIAAYVAA